MPVITIPSHFTVTTASLQTNLMMILTSPLHLSVIAVLGCLAIGVYFIFLREYFCAFYNLPGPPKTHWFWGNMLEVFQHGPELLQHLVGETYGHTYRQYVVGGGIHASTVDLKAVNYMFLHPDLFIKPEGAARILTDALGRGLVTVEGHEHRRQRRVVNPAFGWVQVQGMAPMIFEKAIELRHRLQAMVEHDNDPLPDGHVDKVPGSRKIDVLKPLSAATLDIIALVGFGYDLHVLDDAPNELREAYTSAIAAAFDINALALAQIEVPALTVIPSRRKKILSEARSKAQRIGGGIVAEKKRLIRDIYDGKIDKGTDIGKDVLSLLIRSNMAPDLREDQKMDDEEIMHQISTVLFAGHETTGTALMWALHQLANNPEIQERLREEILTVPDDQPSFETLHALPYLDKVIHECLRLETPIPLTVRIATRDTMLPLENPVVGRNGKVMESFRVKKGDMINIPISYLNNRTDIWGKDSRMFNPDRWDKQHQPIPGVWGNMMTFIAGPRNCIGHRLTILEMKIVLFTLLRGFAFEVPPSKPVLKRTCMIISRGVIKGEEDRGPQMPLMVRPL